MSSAFPTKSDSNQPAHPQRLPTNRVGGNRKRNQQSTNADQKSKETVFFIAIFRHTGDSVSYDF